MASKKKKKNKDKKEKKLKQKSSKKVTTKKTEPSEKKKTKKKSEVKLAENTVSVPAVFETFQNLIEVMEPISKEPMTFNDQHIYQSEIEALKIIGDNQPVTLNELSEILNISKSAVLKTVNKLQIKGLVEKDKAPSGARQVAVSLTSKGEKASEEIPAYEEKLSRPVTGALESLSAKELAIFNGSLERILAQINKSQAI